MSATTHHITCRSARAVFVSLMAVGLLTAAGEARAERPALGTVEAPAAQVQNILSFRDWEGSWDLQWEFQGKWYGKVMDVNATSSGIAGDYVLGTLEGDFVQGDISRVKGTITNVTGTGSTCKSGKQAGFFSLTLAADGRSMAGWWDVCGEGTKWTWKAKKR